MYQHILSSSGSNDDDDNDVSLMVETRDKTKRPRMYKVILLNDDYTPMEFVILILQQFFGMTDQESVNVMLKIHNKGLAVAGVYNFEIAETKVVQVMNTARQHQHPLRCIMEKE